MDRTELANTLNILKNDKSEQKGFSLRRTLKVLNDYEKMKPAIEFRQQLQEAAKNERERQNFP